MSVKNLFKTKINKPLSKKSVVDVGGDVESQRFVEAKVEDQKRFVPYVDFSDPANFARYGTAEMYYKDALARVYNDYPFDGSLYEKQAYHNSSSNLDNYIFENEYPRTNGYIMLSRAGWGTRAAASSSEGFYEPTTKEYIQITGTMNLGPAGTRVGANIYATASTRTANLKLDGNSGFTVEFWLKKGNLAPATAAGSEAIFDLWNGTTVGHGAGSEYGRLLIYLTTQTDPTSCFKITCVSGTVNACTEQTIGVADSSMDTGSILNETWNHFAISGINNGAALDLRLYKNGDLNDYRSIGAGAINEVTGALVANIGAVRTQAIVGEAVPAVEGGGKLSGSLDEFRFWKTRRTSAQVGKYWFTQVGGGTNTDPANTNLGVYYKFNEGITLSASVDSNVLDYSGRLSHGTWLGYAAGARETGSAMILSSASLSEFEDPIIYSHHYSVANLYSTLVNKAIYHDVRNNASLYHSNPGWMIDEDRANEGENLLKLTQIMGSYFDDLHLQIENLPNLQSTDYISASFKPSPFADRQLRGAGFVTPEIFVDATVLNKMLSRDENRNFSDDLSDVKNLIYQNIYNNLSYIYKSKGTEKSFRNLIRCFGVDDELIKLNLYANNETYELKNNYRATSVKKKYADFNNTDRFSSLVYQYPTSGDSNTAGFISGSLLKTEVSGYAMTVEAEVFFPKKFAEDNEQYFLTPFTSASLFGCHTAGPTGTETTWGDNGRPDSANFIVVAERDELESKRVQFRLTGTVGGFFPNLASDFYEDVYNNEKWNFAVRVKHTKHPFSTAVAGTQTHSPNMDYTVELYGVNAILDEVQNEFVVSSSLPSGSIEQFMSGSKRFFIGAHRTNYTGSTVLQTDAKISSFRCWMDYLSDDAIKYHAYDASNFGRTHPYRNAFLNQGPSDGTPVPSIDTLLFNWDFSNVTGSDANGRFTVDDFSSGSTDNLARYGSIGNILKYQYPGRGDKFPTNSTNAVDVEYISSARQLLPETIGSSDMVEILSDDDDIFTRESRPITHFLSIEKSMYQTISEEMINFFASITDFNNLIGEPVNRYRMDYKDMSKLRQLFYERVQNVPDLERYIEFYKWIDSSLSQMLQQLVPATADVSEDVRNMVENHVLARNKYWTKYPTLEMKSSDPEAGAVGINKHLFDWEHGHASIPAVEKNNCLYWSKRAERDKAPLVTSNGTDETRKMVFTASVQVLERQWTTPYRFMADESRQVGPVFERGKKPDYFSAATAYSNLTRNTLYATASTVISEQDCEDVLDPNKKLKRSFQVLNVANPVGIDGKQEANKVMPFEIFSSSVSGGYQDQLGQFTPAVSLEGHHLDVYGPDYEIPAQGPFTEAHVGGRQYRHYTIESGSTTATEITRPEGWRLFVTKGKLHLQGPEAIGLNATSIDLPRGSYYRDEMAKRPVNLRNIVHKNYKNTYEVVQTCGRRYNNPSLVKSGSYNLGDSGDVIEGIASYTVPDRGKNKHAFVERFNAPGGPETNAEESLDLEAAEYSAYNCLNYRNLIVRTALNNWQSSSTARFGFDSSIGAKANPRNYEGSASYHKIQRNTLLRIEQTGSRAWGLTTSSLEDNWFIQHPIPQDDRGYPWISASVLIMPDSSRATGSEITFLSASDVGSFYDATSGERKFNVSYAEYVNRAGAQWIPATLVNLNYFIQEPVSASDNTLGHVTTLNWANLNNGAFNTDFIDAFENSTSSLNTLINKREGPYNHPTWKQIRTGEHPVARALRKANTISVMEPEPVRILSSSQGQFKVRAQRSQVHKNYIEPIATRTHPIIQVVKTAEGSLSMKSAYSNALVNFSNEGLNKKLGLDPVKKQIYHKLLSMYAGDITGPVEELISLSYKEEVYPKAVNLYQDAIRRRTVYSVPYWRNGRTNRDETNKRNSQGFVVNQSIWGVDARSNWSNAQTVTGTANSEGELQNAYSTFFAQPGYDKEPSLMGNINPKVMSFNTSSIRSDFTYPDTNVDWYQDVVICSASAHTNADVGGTKVDWNDLLGVATDQFTLSAWVNPTSSLASRPNKATIMEFGDGDFSFYLATGSHGTNGVTRRLAFSASFLTNTDNEYVTIGSPIAEGSWHHVAATVSKSEPEDDWVALYVDGALQVIYNSGKTGIGAQDAITPNICQIGSSSAVLSTVPAPFMGKMSDLAIFTGSLNLAQIGEIYNNGAPRSFYQHSQVAALLTWWRCGGGAGMFTGSHAEPMAAEISCDVYAAGISGHLGAPKIGNDAVSWLISESGSIKNRIYDMASVHDAIPQFGRIAKQASVDSTPVSSSLVGSHGLLGHAQVREQGWADEFKVGAQYHRRSYEFVSIPWSFKEISSSYGPRQIRMTGSRAYGGDTKWTAGSERGVAPSAETYEEYAKDIRVVGKNYGLVPEFRISDLMTNYVEDDGLNFAAEKDNFLTITGSAISSSAADNFFKTYSHSDFMKYFEVIEMDHADIAPAAELKLKCKGIMKFLPYKGFYPQDRTLQLAQLFSRSYGDHVKPGGYSTALLDNPNVNSEATASWRSFFNPMFGPGLLYNSIKSGMATDYPIYNSAPATIEDFKSGIGNFDFVSGGLQDPPYHEGNWATLWQLLSGNPSITSHGVFTFPLSSSVSQWYIDCSGQAYPSNSSSYAEITSLVTVTPESNDMSAEWYTVLKDKFSKRLPFEALVEPENYLAKQKIYDMEPEASASLRLDLADHDTNQASVWGGEGDQNYKLAMHNFLAEVPNFFLKDEKMTTFASKPVAPEGITITEEEANKYFGMDVAVSNCKCKSLSDFHQRKNLPEYRAAVDNFGIITKDQMETVKGVHTQMYSRDSAFGPPWVHNDYHFTASDTAFSYHHSYEPFTPAYFNGYGTARVLFHPYKGAGTYTLDEIQSHLTTSFMRFPTDRLKVAGTYLTTQMMEWTTLASLDENVLISGSEDGAEHIYRRMSSLISASQQWQQLTSSVNLFGKVKAKKVTYERGLVKDLVPVSAEDSELDVSTLWTIQPKWETPILNFFNKTPESPSASAGAILAGTGSLAKGMWHQHGEQVTGSQGIWLSVGDFPDVALYTTGCVDTSVGNGCMWKNRTESVVETKKTNASVTLYIRDQASLNGRTFELDGTNIYPTSSAAFRPAVGNGYAETGSEPLTAAQNIAEKINTMTVAGGSPSIYMKNRYTASAFLADSHPWIDNGGINQYPIAGVKITVKDVATVNVNYPDYYASGELGNSKIARLVEGSGSAVWSLKGESLGGRDKVFADEVFFSEGQTPKYKVESMADLLGFRKTQERLGRIADEKIIKEAVVAIPFVEENGVKKFFKIQPRLFELALGEKKKSETEDEPGKSIISMATIMKDYVFPPKMDFYTNRNIDPFAMYIFEFKHTLTKSDLSNIWQNLPPEIGSRFESQEVSINHELLGNEFLRGKIEGKLRWMVYKVKQKAAQNYYDITADTSDDARFNLGNKGGDVPPYSYNYPYDFFSLVELIELGTEVKFEPKKEKK